MCFNMRRASTRNYTVMIFMLGPNFLGPKFLGAQTSLGPDFSGTKQVRGPNKMWDHFSCSHILARLHLRGHSQSTWTIFVHY